MKRHMLPALLFVAAAIAVAGCSSEASRPTTAEERAARFDDIARSQQHDQPASPGSSPPLQTERARPANARTDDR